MEIGIQYNEANKFWIKYYHQNALNMNKDLYFKCLKAVGIEVGGMPISDWLKTQDSLTLLKFINKLKTLSNETSSTCLAEETNSDTL